jgi:hypothetical protein
MLPLGNVGAAWGAPMRDSMSVRPSGWRIASRAWRSVFQAMARMPVLFVSAFVLFLMLQAFALVPVNHAVMQRLPLWSFFAGALVQNIASALLTAPVAVAVHRWVLLNDVQRGGLSWKPPYTRLFFLWALTLHLVYMVMSLPTMMFTAEMVRSGIVGKRPAPGILLNLLPVLAVMVVSVYLALVFPDVAIGEPSTSWIARMKTSAARVRGNFWLLVRAAILAFLPLIIIQIIEAFAETRVSGRVLVTMDLLSPATAARTVIGAATAVLGVGLAAATVSWLYSWARSQKAEVTSG